MAEVDDLHTNPLFKFLDAGNSLKQAASRKWTVLVPVSESLRATQITRDFALSHILSSQASTPGTYLTLAKHHSVDVSEEAITTIVSQNGFQEARKCNILLSEQYYTESFDCVSIVRVEQPLCGPVDAQYLARLRRQVLSAVPVCRRDVNENMHVLTTVLGDGVRVVARESALVAQEVTLRYVMARGFEDALYTKLCVAAARTFMHAIDTLVHPSARSPASSSVHPAIASSAPFRFSVAGFRGGCWLPAAWRQAQLAAYGVLLAQLHPHITEKLAGFYQREDRAAAAELARLRAVLVQSGAHALAGLPAPPATPPLPIAPEPAPARAPAPVPAAAPDHPFFGPIGLRPDLRAPLGDALAAFATAPAQPSATLALAAIADAVAAYKASVAQHAPAGADVAVSAEDTLAILLFLLAAAPPANPCSLAAYLRHFRPRPGPAGMGYAGNGVGLPEDPAAADPEQGRLDSLVAALDAAVQVLVAGSLRRPAPAADAAPQLARVASARSSARPLRLALDLELSARPAPATLVPSGRPAPMVRAEPVHNPFSISTSPAAAASPPVAYASLPTTGRAPRPQYHTFDPRLLRGAPSRPPTLHTHAAGPSASFLQQVQKQSTQAAHSQDDKMGSFLASLMDSDTSSGGPSQR